MHSIQNRQILIITLFIPTQILILQEIIADRSNDQVVRWFASVHLKNTTQRVWKRKGST